MTKSCKNVIIIIEQRLETFYEETSEVYLEAIGEIKVKHFRNVICVDVIGDYGSKRVV